MSTYVIYNLSSLPFFVIETNFCLLMFISDFLKHYFFWLQFVVHV